MNAVLKRIAIILFVLASCAPALTGAQGEFPSRAVHIVLGFSAGGVTDLIARALASKLSEFLGVPVLVENKPGANGNIAAEYVVKARPDGYTLLYNTSAVILDPLLGVKVPFEVFSDLAPIALTQNVPLVLATNPSVPANNVREFVAYAKANPGKLDYGSAGTGNVTHLATLLFLGAAGISANHIPYKGAADAFISVTGGHTQFFMNSVGTSIPYFNSGRLKGLAVTSSKRIASIPDVPTLAETVAPGFELGVWAGVMAPAKTPAPIIRKLSAEIAKALQHPDVLATFTAQVAEPMGSTPEQYEAFLKSERVRWAKVITSAGLRRD